MRKNIITASLICAGLFFWLLSGFIFKESEGEAVPAISEQQLRAKPQAEQKPVTVRAAISMAEKRARILVLRGRTDSKRSVDVKSEIAGNVVKRAVERGSRVETGDVLCQLAIDDRDVSVAEATAALKDSQIEYQGSLKLKQQGLQSDTAIARAKAKLESAKALQESEGRLKSLFEESADAVLIYKDGLLVDCNQAAVDMLRLETRKQFLNCTPADISPELQPDGCRSKIKSVEMVVIPPSTISFSNVSLYEITPISCARIKF